jgi:pyruvate dehydrogenase E2 component (dihydrolipoamide acetyltransferase)
MAAFEFKLPDIGEGVTEGEIVEWHVKPGDTVDEDDPMVEVMTDKATVTIGAPRKGVIGELRFDVGTTAAVGSVLVVIEVEGAVSRPATATAAAASPAMSSAPVPVPTDRATAPRATGPQATDGPAATAVGDIREALPGGGYFQSAQPQSARPQSPRPQPPRPQSTRSQNGNGASARHHDHFEPKPLATPATRKLARDLDVDLRRVPPTGPGGRVTREDVEAASDRPSIESTRPTMMVPPKHAPVSTRRDDDAAEERKPFVGIRRRIAERMQASKNTAAHFTFVEECDCERLVALRARLRPAAEAAGVKLSYLPFIVKATVAALKKHPTLNSALDAAANELVFYRRYHIGIAAATPMGLMVPVIRDADRLSLLDVAREIDRLGEGARAGTLSPQELTGSTFTITSLGKQGGLLATPVLNTPEVGILGVHQMKRRPVVRDEQIVIGDVMLLSLSFDHRLVDGHIGAAFAYEIISYLEDPDRLFLEMV